MITLKNLLYKPKFVQDKFVLINKLLPKKYVGVKNSGDLYHVNLSFTTIFYRVFNKTNFTRNVYDDIIKGVISIQ